jgi:hypothetical protein
MCEAREIIVRRHCLAFFVGIVVASTLSRIINRHRSPFWSHQNKDPRFGLSANRLRKQLQKK